MTGSRRTLFFYLAFVAALGLLAAVLFRAVPARFAAPIVACTLLGTTLLVVSVLQRGVFSRVLAMTTSVAIAPVAILGIVNDHAARASLAVRGDRILRSAAERTTRYIDEFLTAALDTVRTEAQNPLFSRFLTEVAQGRKEGRGGVPPTGDLEAFLRSRSVRDTVYVESIGLIESAGIVVADSDRKRIGTSEAGTAVFLDVSQRRLPSLAMHDVDDSESRAGLLVSAPVRAPTGEIVGMVRVRYDAAVLQGLVARDRDLLGEGSFVMLVGETGRILAHSLEPEFVGSDLSSCESLLDERLFGSVLDSMDDLSPMGEDRGMRVTGSRATVAPWRVYFAQSPKVFLASLDAQSRNNTILVIVLSACLFVISWLLARRIVRPVKRLCDAADRVTQGDLDARVSISGTDELSVLGAAFNRLAQGLQTSLQGLRGEIVERERMANELKGSEERFRALVESAIDMVLITDETGRITYATPTATSGFGHPASAIVGRSLLDFVAPEGREAAQAFLNASGPEGDRPASFEVVTRRRGRRVVEAVRREAFDVPGIRGAIVTLRDVTDRRSLEEQLLQARKIEGIGLLAGGVAHDFNNLLVPIFGHSEIAIGSLEAGHPARAHLGQVVEAAESAKRLVQQLLAFGRKQTLSVEVVDLRAVVADIESLLRCTLREDVLLRVNQSETELAVEADVTQIRQVAMNLVMNAQDAMPNGGDLELTIRRNRADDATVGSGDAMPDGEFAVLEVRDSGQGMDEVTRRRVFEPFFTTKATGKGTGLGLATVYGIVRQHRGCIRFESEPRQGTKFRVFFPLATSEPSATHAKHDEPAANAGGTVLLVEDDARVRELVASVLTSAGYDVVAADGPAEAIARAGSGRGPFDLLLTDVIMPHLNGRALYERLREKQPSLRVLYMSGYSGDAIARHGILDPGTELIAKPFQTDELLKRVAGVIDAGRRTQPAPLGVPTDEQRG